MKLEFFCKTHNKLCCVCCIAKIETNRYGQYKNCNVCTIQEINEEKKNKLKDNLKYLKDLSWNLNQAIKEIKRRKKRAIKIENKKYKMEYLFLIKFWIGFNLIFNEIFSQ